MAQKSFILLLIFSAFFTVFLSGCQTMGAMLQGAGEGIQNTHFQPIQRNQDQPLNIVATPMTCTYNHYGYQTTQQCY